MDLKDTAIAIGALVAAATFILGYVQYRRGIRLERAKYLMQLRMRREKSASIRKLIPLLDDDDERLREAEWIDKIEFISYYKDIALLVNSGLLSQIVAFHLFGNHAIRCWQSDHFWCDMDRTSVFFAIFVDFAKKMESICDASPATICRV